MPRKKAKKTPDKFSRLWKKWQARPGKPWPEKSGAMWRDLFNDIIQDYCRKNKIGGELREKLLDLSCDRQVVRLSVMQDLLKMPRQKAVKAVPLLRILLRKDPDTDIREIAAHHLGLLGAREAVPDLIRALERDVHGYVILGAVSGLEKLKDKRAVPALVKAMTLTGDRSIDNVKKSFELRRHAAMALGEIAPKMVKGRNNIEQFKMVSRKIASVGLFPDQAGLVKFLVATDPKLRAKLPSPGKAGRERVEYLNNFIAQASEHSFREMLSIFGFDKGAKK